MIADPNIRYAHLFDTANVRNSVGIKSLKAGLTNTISQGASLFITLLRAAILARLLTPEDYGVFTMVIVVVSIAVIFKDLGLSTATIREKEISHAQVSNLFWINALIGAGAMLIVIATSPAIAWFYRDPRLTEIAIALSIAFLFGGLSVQHQALLKRQMQFGKIAYLTIFSCVFSSLIGVSVAWLGYNYWALIWMNVSQNLFLMIGFWFATGWKPGMPTKGVGTKKFIKIGLDVAGLNAFSTITKNIDKIIAGQVSTASHLGLYIKGTQVPGMVSGQFRMAFFSVAMPALSTLQNDQKQFASYYYKFLNVVAWVTMSLSVFCFVFAEDIILIYFGSKWLGATVYMKFFAVNSFFLPVMTTLDQIPLSLGHSRQYLIAGIIRSIGTIFCVSLGGYFYDIIGIAAGVVLGNIITFFPFFLICVKNSSIVITKYLNTIAIPSFISISTGTIFYFLNIFTSHGNMYFHVAIMLSYLITVIVILTTFDYFKIGFHLGIINTIQKHHTGRK